MTASIRAATAHDAALILAIYAPIVRDTAISFETEVPTVEQMQQRIVHTVANLPWLVCDHEGEILGYVYASPHRTRAAYQWSVDVSVYIQAGTRRMGVGRALYTALFQCLQLQGFYNCYAGITLPNPASIGLHEALGFLPVGIYRAVGYKQGAWHDVGWWQLALPQAGASAPVAPRDFPTLMQHATAWERAIVAGSSRLQV